MITYMSPFFSDIIQKQADWIFREYRRPSFLWKRVGSIENELSFPIPNIDLILQIYILGRCIPGSIIQVSNEINFKYIEVDKVSHLH